MKLNENIFIAFGKPMIATDYKTRLYTSFIEIHGKSSRFYLKNYKKTLIQMYGNLRAQIVLSGLLKNTGICGANTRMIHDGYKLLFVVDFSCEYYQYKHIRKMIHNLQ
jgi:hypothetical protein